MTAAMGAPLLLLALALMAASPRATRVLGDDGDFDLADALDPDPTSRPSGGLYPKLPADPHGGGIYPKLPADPLPSDPYGGGVYPPPRPRPQPQPRPQPSDNTIGGSGGYGGGHGGHDTHGSHNDGGGGAQGNTVARIVSPIVSVMVVALVGASVNYFRSTQRRRGCLGRSDPETV